MNKIKYLLTILGATFLINVYSQEDTIELVVPRYRIKNTFFKTILENIISFEKEYESKEDMVLYNDLHLIIIEKKHNESFNIIIVKGNKNNMLANPITMSTIGFFYLHKELFIIKGDFLEMLFEIKSCEKSFKCSDEVFLIDDSLEWHYTFFNGFLFLESGVIGIGK